VSDVSVKKCAEFGHDEQLFQEFEHEPDAAVCFLPNVIVKSPPLAGGVIDITLVPLPSCVAPFHSARKQLSFSFLTVNKPVRQ
tara:strand:+ start:287 stop:535 length:249 start_codon:yes stop_codon:yes gene_type:complete